MEQNIKKKSVPTFHFFKMANRPRSTELKRWVGGPENWTEHPGAGIRGEWPEDCEVWSPVLRGELERGACKGEDGNCGGLWLDTVKHFLLSFGSCCKVGALNKRKNQGKLKRDKEKKKEVWRQESQNKRDWRLTLLFSQAREREASPEKIWEHRQGTMRKQWLLQPPHGQRGNSWGVEDAQRHMSLRISAQSLPKIFLV